MRWWIDLLFTVCWEEGIMWSHCLSCLYFTVLHLMILEGKLGGLSEGKEVQINRASGLWPSNLWLVTKNSNSNHIQTRKPEGLVIPSHNLFTRKFNMTLAVQKIFQIWLLLPVTYFHSWMWTCIHIRYCMNLMQAKIFELPLSVRYSDVDLYWP